MSLVLAVSLFFLFAIVLPVVRQRAKIGETGVVVHRAKDPLHALVGLAFGGALALLAVWTVAVAVFGPARLGVIEAPLPVTVAGWAVFLASLGLVMGSQAAMGRSWRIGIDERPTDLVTHGVYAHIRHPIYTGVQLLAFALALIAPSVATALGVPIVMAVVGLEARLEEAHMAKQHGAVWDAYAARSGRFLPRW